MNDSIELTSKMVKAGVEEFLARLELPEVVDETVMAIFTAMILAAPKPWQWWSE